MRFEIGETVKVRDCTGNWVNGTYTDKDGENRHKVFMDQREGPKFSIVGNNDVKHYSPLAKGALETFAAEKYVIVKQILDSAFAALLPNEKVKLEIIDGMIYTQDKSLSITVTKSTTRSLVDFRERCAFVVVDESGEEIEDSICFKALDIAENFVKEFMKKRITEHFRQSLYLNAKKY